MRLVITHLSGAYRGERQVYVPARLTIGRGRDNDVRLGRDDTIASAHHAEILVDRGAIHLRDLGSTNGVYVDGRRVEQVRLRGGETVAFGYGGPQLLVELLEELPDERPSLDVDHEFPFRAGFARSFFVSAAVAATISIVCFVYDLPLFAIPTALVAALLFFLGFAFVRINITVGPEGIEHQGFWSTKHVAWSEIVSLDTWLAPRGVRVGARCAVRGTRETIEFSPSDFREGHLLATLIAETSGKEWGSPG